MFCAIATTIERCKVEGVVDVFQVVKALRIQKPGAVRTVVRNVGTLLLIIPWLRICRVRLIGSICQSVVHYSWLYLPSVDEEIPCLCPCLENVHASPSPAITIGVAHACVAQYGTRRQVHI